MTELNQLPPPPKRPGYTKEQVDCYLEAIKELHGKMTVEILDGETAAQAFMRGANADKSIPTKKS